MPSTASEYKHVVIREDGVPIIESTTTKAMKIVDLVEEVMAYGWSPEELYFNHPYLSLGQIHSALAYYWDHREELDQEIERGLQQFDEARRAAGPSPLVVRLKSMGLL